MKLIATKLRATPPDNATLKSHTNSPVCWLFYWVVGVSGCLGCSTSASPTSLLTFDRLLGSATKSSSLLSINVYQNRAWLTQPSQAPHHQTQTLCSGFTQVSPMQTPLFAGLFTVNTGFLGQSLGMNKQLKKSSRASLNTSILHGLQYWAGHLLRMGFLPLFLGLPASSQVKDLF